LHQIGLELADTASDCRMFGAKATKALLKKFNRQESGLNLELCTRIWLTGFKAEPICAVALVH
jgi:hypothetical protein